MSSSRAPDDIWRPLLDELDRWAETGLTADLWLRDDDAVEVTSQLETLSELCERFAVPCLIAAIPVGASAQLAAYTAKIPMLSIGQHGFSHRNHAPAGIKAQEFPPHRLQREIEAELSEGHARLGNLFGEQLLPFYVPPWNRIVSDIAALLPQLGFRAISTFGRKPLFTAAPPLTELNTHVDIIDWRGNRGGREAAWLAADLAGELKWSRESGGGAPIGVLTHHLVHDAAAWNFLEALFALTTDHRCVRWRRAGDLAGLGQR